MEIEKEKELLIIQKSIIENINKLNISDITKAEVMINLIHFLNPVIYEDNIIKLQELNDITKDLRRLNYENNIN